ncbi:MAG TPA: ATP-binding protein [Solirubrobacteraceae bacterium]|jgi:signal transduction histidine kinase/CheY-like chemotaxis protein/HAMP domain-containing protein|nr:ATP-binding protein [Solirubrobacteraceae bacterium]
MRRLSIARTVVVALLGLSLVLAVLAGVGVASLYSTRQHYENRLAQTFELQTAAGQLLAAAVVEEATLRDASGPGAGHERLEAKLAFNEAIAHARADAAGNVDDLALIQRIAADEAALRRLPSSAQRPLAARQDIATLSSDQLPRRAQARAKARSDTRRAVTTIAVSGGLALGAAMALVAVLLARLRRPLDDLVGAGQRLAEGDLRARVHVGGPLELRVLGSSFNAMADELAAALERLDVQRRRLLQTIESLGDALLVVDAQGRILAANPRAGELVGELTVGSSLADAAEPLPPLREALGSEVIIDRGGLTLAATAAPLEAEDGSGAGQTVWTIRDVTERARLERLKSEFVATASHELRSPLTSIKGFMELLAHGTALDERQREFVDIVMTSTDRLVDLVSDLLDVARIEAGQVDVHRRPIDVREVAREVLDLMSAQAREKHQQLELRAADDLPRAQADADRVRQILINLITNAHLYTPAGGHIAVELSADSATVGIEVSDDGPGMDPVQLAQIFDRFYRGTQRERGTGLGLSIVKSLVDLHEGTIDVTSAPGEGTGFLVRLPRAISPALGERAREALRGRHVLVVDDEESIAQLIVERLGALGAAAEAVGDGRTAMTRLRERDWDAVTLDVLMPGMSGLEVLREIRADPRLAGIPVVIVSVLSPREALTGERVVRKPIDAEQLGDALGSAVLARHAEVLVLGREETREQAASALRAMGANYDWAVSGPHAVSQLSRGGYRVVLVDSGLPGALERVAELQGAAGEERVAVLAYGDGENEVDLARLGAESVRLEDLPEALMLAIQQPSRPQ